MNLQALSDLGKQAIALAENILDFLKNEKIGLSACPSDLF
jgi:hypothetical protein